MKFTVLCHLFGTTGFGQDPSYLSDFISPVGKGQLLSTGEQGTHSHSICDWGNADLAHLVCVKYTELPGAPVF